MFPESKPRILPDDILIACPEVEEITDQSTSSVYEDPELMALRIVLGPRKVRWIAREVHELRARRVAENTARAETVRAEVKARRERRLAKQRNKGAV